MPHKTTSLFVHWKAKPFLDIGPHPFKELLPMKLKNSVSGKSEKTINVACIQEMAVMLDCFKANKQSQKICSEEVKAFQACAQAFDAAKKLRREMDAKGTTAPGTKRLTTKQLNRLLSEYPQPK